MYYICALSEWETPASHYPRTQRGEVEIATKIYTPGLYSCYNTHPPGDDNEYLYFEAKEDLPITILKIHGETWMVDDPPHWWGMQGHADEFHGHVVCAGLGLGLMVHALDANPDVESITIVERNRDVIDLIGPLVPKCKIIEADWYAYQPDQKFDCVLYDLFLGESAGLQATAIREMIEISQRFPGAKVRLHGISAKWLDSFMELYNNAVSLVTTIDTLPKQKP